MQVRNPHGSSHYVLCNPGGALSDHVVVICRRTPTAGWGPERSPRLPVLAWFAWRLLKGRGLVSSIMLRLMPVAMVLLVGLTGCTHLRSSGLWPFHPEGASVPQRVDELLADTLDGGSHFAVAQYWEGNMLLVDLGEAAGQDGLRLRPAAGAPWPMRLGFRVQPGHIGQLEVEGAQRVVYSVPSSGEPVLLRLDPGVCTPRTRQLTLRWHPADMTAR